MKSLARRCFLASAAALLAGAALPALAQGYPAKPVRFIVPFPPAGPVDTTARAFTQKLSEYWGQQALVENRAGAGGIVGAEAAAKSTRTAIRSSSAASSHSVLPSLNAGCPTASRRISCRSPSPPSSRSSSWLTRPFRRRRCRRSSPTRRRTRESSRSARPATAAGRTSPASCSRPWPASICCTSRSRAARRR